MKKKSMLAALVMLSLLQGSVYAEEPGEVDGNSYSFNGVEIVGSDNYVNKVDGTYNDYKAVYGNGSQSATNDITGGTLTIVDGADISNSGNSVTGVVSKGKVSNGIVNMTGGTVWSVNGGASFGVNLPVTDEGAAHHNIINFSGGEAKFIRGGYAQYGSAKNNNVTLTGGTLNCEEIEGGNVYGGLVTIYGHASDNTVTVENIGFESVSGIERKGYIYGGRTNAGNSSNNTVTIKNIENNNEDISVCVYGGAALGGYYGDNPDFNADELKPVETYANGNTVEVFGGTINEAIGAMNYIGIAEGNKVNINGATVLDVINGAYGNTVIGNEVNITGNSIIGKEGEAGEIVGGFSKNGNVIGNSITLSGNSTVYGEIVGGLSSYINEGGTESYEVTDNSITLAGNSTIIGHVYGGSAGDDTVKVSGNSITLQDLTNVEKADLYGYKPATTTFSNNVKSSAGDRLSNNNLIIDGWTGTANSVQNFNNINFNNLVWQPDNATAILSTNAGNIGGTNFNLTLKSGQQVKVNETMTIFSSEKDLGDIANDGGTFDTTMGTATNVSGVVEQSADNKTVTATIKDIELADQTMLVAESRAVAAAFVNQGTDLIADSLDTLSRDGKYGVKTFAAVHGNRSKYDVNSDLKINGWSTIVGVGSETEHNGGDFSWGVFYENGSGNYRTFNSFNNEYFRGDGSLVYNGGGIAARYENAHGVYTEGSLRAGMLKSDMDNALSDGENKYGYSSESEYYGAHIGIGQIIPLTESSDLDVYGKFFHTYTEGDSFIVDTDEFEFDSINSDRLRVGARLTTNKENKFSTYYGLAYEYEFNGDAEMRAAGMSAPTQSLQGSSYMAEVGFNYQPTPESPWSFDLNMRGYAGERQGGSFNVQATYTF